MASPNLLNHAVSKCELCLSTLHGSHIQAQPRGHKEGMWDAEENVAYMEGERGTFSGWMHLQEAVLSTYCKSQGLWPGKVCLHLFSQLQSP